MAEYREGAGRKQALSHPNSKQTESGRAVQRKGSGRVSESNPALKEETGVALALQNVPEGRS